MTYKQASYENTAKTIIKKLEQRGMVGYYCADSASAKEMVMTMIPKGSSVTWGGSESMVEIGVIDAITNGEYVAVNRKAPTSTTEEAKELKANMYNADFFLTGTNAITVEGELINIDGNGNRVACMINGPRTVIVVVGMNKLVTTVDEGINRVHFVAGPPNAVRVGANTPCKTTGVCTMCTGNNSMCAHTVITRSSMHKDRIHVILVGEELGF